MNVIKTVFGEKSPFLTTNKWKLGHIFGASGMLRLELGLFMLQPQQVLEVPFSAKQMHLQKIRNVPIKAAGFGGNEVSVLLSE